MKKLFAFIIFISLSGWQCKKCKDEGTGGKVTVVCDIYHHEGPTHGDTVYVKFGTKDLPGTKPTDYDLTVIGDPNSTTVNVTNLKCGDYYFYAVGLDTVPQRVTGGRSVSFDEEDGTIQISLPVTE